MLCMQSICHTVNMSHARLVVNIDNASQKREEKMKRETEKKEENRAVCDVL